MEIKRFAGETRQELPLPREREREREGRREEDVEDGILPVLILRLLSGNFWGKIKNKIIIIIIIIKEIKKELHRLENLQFSSK